MDLCEFQRHDVGAVIARQSMEVSSELLPGFGHFCGIAMSLVDALHLVLFGVIQAALCYLRQDAHHCHERGPGSPKVMWSPFPAR